MAQEFATFVFDGEKMTAFDGNRVIASGTDHQHVAETAEAYFDSLKNEKDKKTHDDKVASATHITTPNGETGKILGRTASIFSDTITVRLDKGGEIRHYETFVDSGIDFHTKEANVPESPIEHLAQRLDETYAHGRQGLTERLADLNDIKESASRLASVASFEDGRKLHQIVLTASAEKNEVTEALDHLITADAEAFAAPERQYVAVEQAEMGRSAGNDWLEVVAQEMIAESDAEDFDKLASEGPTTFVANLELGALGNEGVIRQMASEFIMGKTAGYQGPEVEEFRTRFVAASEMARRQELLYRKDEMRQEATVREASVSDAPDESLFL
jgi:hypothetical protein